MLSYKITKLNFLPPLSAPITISLRYKYYLDESWTTVAANIDVATDGTLDTPQTISDLSFDTRYTVQAINDNCETVFQEDIFLPADQDSNLWINWDGGIFLNSTGGGTFYS